ncbi:heavy-metal-associated domain-containing protein [Oscillibacter sp.]|uniref:heavy-metal-associated domain-containing protein n=1 Tax=Oscillibacter sp. TaxID=1945593 RepID=UPI002617BAAB|nr:heavy-metal-associated domain-containing protein [Oscillibacter sp.]MDD3346849.1 heavy-metal-associated domain-containing protein [Oscillibacter sp.]
MAHLSTYFSLEDAAGRHDTALLKRELDALPGVTSVSVGNSGCLAVDYDSTGVRQEQIRQKIQELGFQLRSGE